MFLRNLYYYADKKTAGTAILQHYATRMGNINRLLCTTTTKPSYAGSMKAVFVDICNKCQHTCHMCTYADL